MRVLVAAAVALGVLPGHVPSGHTAEPAGTQRVVVSTLSAGDAWLAETTVVRLGGTLERELPIVDGFVASMPARTAAYLRQQPGVRSVTPDARGHVLAVDPALGYDTAADSGGLGWIAKLTGATSSWSAGFTGKGVDVALIDSGVAKVQGLTSGNVVNGPDLSFDSQLASAQYVDGYGHGTHLASIIAGRDAVGTPASYATSRQFTGLAPDARVINVRVAASDGSADVSQVIAAIGWVTQHAHDSGLNIRVLNLAYGLDSTQDYRLDPLSYAVEQAWRKGIVVVVAAGNDGTARQQLASPAIDPYVLAVGAEDPNGTVDVNNDTVPTFAQRGTAGRHVDVVVPGVHVLGLRAPGSTVDVANPTARVGTRFIRGSGTSQATAATSALAALLLQKFPTATPDQIKYALRTSGRKLTKAADLWQGVGVVDVAKAQTVRITDAVPQAFPAATGLGTLELARGSSHVTLDGVTISGEQDILGHPWNAASWASAVAGGRAWVGGTFNGWAWAGTGWASPNCWGIASWASWDLAGDPLASRTWVSRTWVSRTWAGNAWSSAGWS
jgi:serine protease AprX